MSTQAGLSISVRAAKAGDVEAMRSIYNHYVINSVVTFDRSEQTYEARLEWLEHHDREGLPVLVAEEDGRVIGWASLSYYHSRCAYRSTVEFSAYLDPNVVGKGVGRALMNELMAQAERKGYHCVVGLICSENKVSLQMASSLGFEVVGELKEVGRKFDRWLNVTFVQKILASK